MTNPLWAPWRMEYILGPKSHDKACIFCGVAEASPDERRERLVIATTPRLFVVLNRYPFAAGHILIVPHAHVAAVKEDGSFVLPKVPAGKHVLVAWKEGFDPVRKEIEVGAGGAKVDVRISRAGDVLPSGTAALEGCCAR